MELGSVGRRLIKADDEVLGVAEMDCAVLSAEHSPSLEYLSIFSTCPLSYLGPLRGQGWSLGFALHQLSPFPPKAFPLKLDIFTSLPLIRACLLIFLPSIHSISVRNRHQSYGFDLLTVSPFHPTPAPSQFLSLP